MKPLVYIVAKTNEKKVIEAIYVFDKHDDALKCRRELGLKSDTLWGTVIGCYDFTLEG